MVRDYATFNSTQQEALIGSYNINRSRDYPTTISIGPSYFDSYSTWPNVSYIHGFNLGKNGSVSYDTLVGTVPLVCDALKGDKLAYWQLGNEPDLYKTSSQGPVRPSWWNETYYVEEWMNKTGTIRQLVQQYCPDVIDSEKFLFYAPSFAGVGNSLNMIKTWQQGLGSGNDIAFVDSHNYISGAEVLGVTLQGTLMNHTSTVLSVNKHLNESRYLQPYTKLGYILGETNSLYNQGRPGLSNTFGACLWGVDFNLYNAATNIKRVHMHQGTNYRYASWQPIDTDLATKGTKAPYYGNIMVAAMLGNLTESNVSISNIDLASEQNTAYAAYVDAKLKRIALVQMTSYNYTDDTASIRPNQSYYLSLPEGSNLTTVHVQRLSANGSDAVSGITFDGYSYNYELNNGLPVLLSNVTRGETIEVGESGNFTILLPFSSAVVLTLA